jgi:hypothetical protein
MIVLNQNSNQEFRLNIGGVNASPVFDLVIVESLSGQRRTVTLTDLSPDKTLFSEFEITTTDDKSQEDLAQTIIYLRTKERYIYRLEDSDGLVDTGYILAI